MLISAETLRAEFLEPIEMAPVLIANLVLIFGLWPVNESYEKFRIKTDAESIT